MSDFLLLNKFLDHAVLHPAASIEILKFEAEVAIQFDVATLCVKPCHVREAYRLLENTSVLVCSVIAFPHGNNLSEIKLAETIKAIEYGAREIDVVVNPGDVIDEKWDLVQKEIEAILKYCLDHKVILKVIFENAYLEKNHKVNLCKICTSLGVHYVKTSTGFGYVKNNEGYFSAKGALENDIILMKQNIGPDIRIKASGGIGNYETALNFIRLGASRIGTSHTKKIMEEWLRNEQHKVR